MKKFYIKNFRAIQELELEFNRGLNILIGENNTGKSAIIDALRICFTYGDQWRDIYIKKSDFYIDKNNIEADSKEIEFHLVFEIENPIETGVFNELLVQNEDNTQELQLHFKYYIEERRGIEKIKHRVWGGEKEGQQITPEVLDLIYSVYLSALRDAVQNLRPTRGNRLGQLYTNLTTDKNGNPIDEEKRKELSSKLISTLSEDEDWLNLLKLGEEKVNEHLLETSLIGKEQSVKIDFFPLDFKRIVDNLRMQIPIYSEGTLQGDESKQKFLEIFQNGLGYNNLIYTATVLGDLKNKREIEPESYIALLIEEPEAHLHPQLQNILFNYLNKLNGFGIQLFVSSHSPTITAKANLDAVIVLQNQNNHVYSLSLSKSNLDDYNKKYLSKFLDVTKSQLFFSNGVILVEGISEALLIAQFSKMIGDDCEYDIEKKGIELVNINGVAFEHFAKLFNSDEEDKRLNIRSVILTDDDRNEETEEISSRAKKAIDLEGGLLKVKLGSITFEYELFIASEKNAEILLGIFQEMHPNAAKRINKGCSLEEFGKNFLEKVKSNKAKSELAHRLVMELITDEKKRSEFVVPEYIKEAIKWVVKGE
ncbi:ATP-dependent nuclease [Bacillus litorisediminis]|uniref:ATP-dependent nuclease n=1 Tax=Bacillus litorisediminis TaxID=2922713 RepID=UPI001FAC5D0C|nr:AAA family ATPase [Bacillus litorisediminis]